MHTNTCMQAPSATSPHIHFADYVRVRGKKMLMHNSQQFFYTLDTHTCIDTSYCNDFMHVIRYMPLCIHVTRYIFLYVSEWVSTSAATSVPNEQEKRRDITSAKQEKRFEQFLQKQTETSQERESTWKKLLPASFIIHAIAAHPRNTREAYIQTHTQWMLVTTQSHIVRPT